MPRVYLSLSYAIQAYQSGKHKVEQCAWIVANTSHHSVEDMFISYNTRVFRLASMPDEEFMCMLEVLWAKLVQPRVLEGRNCGHFSGYARVIEIPPDTDLSTPAAAIQAMRDWQMLNGWYDDAQGVRYSMHDKKD
jgi:hypothetical protein